MQPPRPTGCLRRCNNSSRAAGLAHPLHLLILAVLLAGMLLPDLAAADCCVATTATADPNAPQSYVLRAQGKSSSFYLANKVYEIKALFPNNYATRGNPTSFFPLAQANCTQGVAPPDNNPNLFSCTYMSNNPTSPTSFGLQWVLVVPPPPPGQQVKPPDFLSLSVNGQDSCTRANDIDACPDPIAPGSSNGGSTGGGSSLTLSTVISLGPIGQLPFWLLLVVCGIILLMFIGFFYTCWRNHRGNPEQRRRASMAMTGGPPSRSPSALPTLGGSGDRPKDDGSSNPQDANWWRRHATQKRTDSGATLPPPPAAAPAATTTMSDTARPAPAATATGAPALSHSRSRSSNGGGPAHPSLPPNNNKPTLITIPDDHSSDSDKPILSAARQPKHLQYLMNEPVPPALEPPTLSTSPPAAHPLQKKSPHLNPVLTSKAELEIPTTVGRRRSYRRAGASEPPTTAAASRASPGVRPTPAPAAPPAARAAPTDVSRSPSNSQPPRRVPPTSAAAVAAALTHAHHRHEVSSTTTGSDEYEDPSNLAAMGIRPNSPEKNDRIRNWAGAIAAVKEEDPPGEAGGVRREEAVVSESEEEPIGLTLGRAGSNSASFNRARVMQSRCAEVESESDEEAPLALSMARPPQPARKSPREEEEDSDEEVPLAATVARGNSGKQQIRPRAPLQIHNTQQGGREQGVGKQEVGDVIDEYLK